MAVISKSPGGLGVRKLKATKREEAPGSLWDMLLAGYRSPWFMWHYPPDQQKLHVARPGCQLQRVVQAVHCLQQSKGD